MVVPILDKDMTLCISLSATPSNNGTRFHNHLYDQLGLPFVYKAFAPTDLEQAIAGVRGLGIRGCAVSMPFKERVIPMVDTLHASAAAIDSVNTIVNDGGHLTAHNTDYSAVQSLLMSHEVATDQSVLIRGSGGMAKAVAAAIHDAGFTTGTIVARNEAAGRTLADLYGFEWSADVGNLRADFLVNVTPLGMRGDAAKELAFSEDAIATASVVLDAVALPSETPLIIAARTVGTHVITGAEVATLQALEQFVLYTGVRPSDEQVRLASEFARAGN